MSALKSPQKLFSDRIAGHIFPSTHSVSSCGKHRVTIGILPDDILLLIFYFGGLDDIDTPHLSWHRLVHVCRRWRFVVFASPNFLDLRLILIPGRSVELIGIWPPLPIVLRSAPQWLMPEDYDFDAAIAHRNRVREIVLCLARAESQFRRFVSAMQEPLPALTHLRLSGSGSDLAWHLVLPDGFLAGSAPRLQRFYLDSISFPALPTFLLSATGLVELGLRDIPDSGYFSPETLVACLAVLTNLKSLAIGFQSDFALSSHWLLDSERRLPLPRTRIVLPALAHFEFCWVSEYLEHLVARIDTPLLDSFTITFFYQLEFDIPQLGEFMRRTTRFQALNEAHVDFRDDGITVKSLPPARTADEESGFRISCKLSYWQDSFLGQGLSSLFPSIYIVEHLYIYGPRYLLGYWKRDINHAQWLERFRPFAAVKNLYLHKEIAQSIARALQELVGERAAHVLPALESIFLEELKPSGPVQESIEQFVAARQFLGRPVAVSHWNEISGFDDPSCSI